MKELERTKNAEIKIYEVQISKLKEEKKRLEELCRDYDDRIKELKDKNSSEMHAMVKYYQNNMQMLEMELKKF